jgi:hypothetical protein
VKGFEPSTPASRKQCSTKLSYTPLEYTSWWLNLPFYIRSSLRAKRGNPETKWYKTTSLWIASRVLARTGAMKLKIQLLWVMQEVYWMRLQDSMLTKKKERLILIGLLLLFLLPYLAAKALLHLPWLIGKPKPHGTLLSPPASLLNLNFLFQEAAKKRNWLLIAYKAQDCSPLNECQQAWKKLENLFLISGQPEKRLRFALITKKNSHVKYLPIDSDKDSFWIVDPKGYLILYYPSTVAIQAMHQDLKQLLKASRIG